MDEYARTSSGSAGLGDSRPLRNLRIGFGSLLALVLLLGAIFAWRSWQAEKEHELLYLSSLSEITGKSLDIYFLDHARSLRQLGDEIVESGHPLYGAATRRLLRQLKDSDPDFLHVSLISPDGQQVVADDTEPGSPVPAGERESFQLAVRAMEMGAEFDVGRAVSVERESEWVLPLRCAIRDPRGKLLFVLSATQPLSRQQGFWQGVPLPEDSAIGLLRDDGYMISRYPVPKAMDYAEAYGKPRNGRLREYLVQNKFPSRGTTEGYNSVAKAEYLFAFYRLSSQRLTVFVSTPLANVRGKWLHQSLFSALLLGVLLVGGYLAYRWFWRHQLAWESERIAHEARIAFLAQHDALTGLPNRLLAEDRLQQATAFASREKAQVALIYLDLDNFKGINDSLGHTVGNQMLKHVAARLLCCLQATDTLCRLGGDEFLIILPRPMDTDDIARVAEATVGALNAPFDIEHQPLMTTVSAGIAVFPDDGLDFETLLRKADTAMYNAKSCGRNTYRFYTEQMNVDADERLRVRNWLRQGLDQGQFVLHYQPQIDLASGAVVGAEALIRLQHPLAGLVMPGRFISIAEDSGLIVPIGTWVLGEACRQLAVWRAAGWTDLVMAVNLSAVQFKARDLEKTIVAALEASGVPPHCLELELTESLLIDNAESVLATMKRLKALGLRFSIDDFGTGYSSLAYLKRFSVDRLKIDQSFVRGLLVDAEDSAIVRAVIQMARSLGVGVIAEGVEDDATRLFLREQGCREAQGYWFGRPMEAERFADYLAARREATAPAGVADLPVGR